MHSFVGRTRELTALAGLYERVEQGGDRPGKAILLRGRRRVGKSRLVEQFIEQADAPSLFFAASGRPPQDELALFVEEVLGSTLPGAGTFEGQRPATWDAALQLLGSAIDRPCIVVLDELPYLTAADPGFEGSLQRAFDRVLSRLPILLIGIGSDLSMMEAMGAYGRPFHQRATEMVLPPLSPAEVGSLLQLPAAGAIDAYLVSGGLPLILDEWPTGATAMEYLSPAVASPTSALLVSAERALSAEFPAQGQARDVLGVIGSGERTFSNLANRLGLQHPSLNRSLKLLQDKRVVDVDHPLSTRPSRETRYRVADPYLRFWLTFIGPNLAEIERGRGDRVLERITVGWQSWRGRAVEPLIREALRRSPALEDAQVVGAYWTRSNDVEVDLVLADREPIAKQIHSVGSIKWLDTAPFDAHDLAQLAAAGRRVPGAENTRQLLAVSRSGTSVTAEDLVVLGPQDIVSAFE